MVSKKCPVIDEQVMSFSLMQKVTIALVDPVKKTVDFSFVGITQKQVQWPHFFIIELQLVCLNATFC